MSQRIPTLPVTGFLRLNDVLKFIPIKKTRWYKGVKSGEFPRPIAFSPRVKVYRVEDIRTLIEPFGSQSTEGAE